MCKKKTYEDGIKDARTACEKIAQYHSGLAADAIRFGPQNDLEEEVFGEEWESICTFEGVKC